MTGRRDGVGAVRREVDGVFVCDETVALSVVGTGLAEPQAPLTRLEKLLAWQTGEATATLFPFSRAASIRAVGLQTQGMSVKMPDATRCS